MSIETPVGRACLLVLILALSARAPVSLGSGTGPLSSSNASIEFLGGLMEEFHDRFPVYDDVSSGGNHFAVPAIIANDITGTTINGSWTDNPYSGATAIRFEFIDLPAANWAGFYLMNGILPDGATEPEQNWGTVPNAGVMIPEATSLTFRARGENGGEQIEFFLGGVGHPDAPFLDSVPKTPASGLNVTLTTDWQQYSISVVGLDLSYVLGGFAWVTNDVDNPGGAVFYVDDIQYELTTAGRDARLNEPRFVRSYKTLNLQPDPFDANLDDDIDLVFRNLAFSYDNALALLAFLAADTADGLRRARLIGDAFVYASLNDRFFADGEIRTAYAAGDLILPPGWTPNGRVGTVSIPGFYYEPTATFFEVEQNDLDVGNNSWVMTALLALYANTSEPSYLAAANRIGDFIRTCKNESGTYQGFQGGIEDPEGTTVRNLWASGEHNIDVFAAFSVIADLDDDPSWIPDALHAQTYVENLWDPVLGCYYAGTEDPDTLNDNYDQLPLDVQTWAVLAFPEILTLHSMILDCIEINHLTLHQGFAGYDFNTDNDGVWFEGMGQAALAYQVAGRPDLAAPLLVELQNAQTTDPFGDGSGIVAATLDGLTTGFGFRYFMRHHIATASWNVFAQLGYNPYYYSMMSSLFIDGFESGDTSAWSSTMP